MLKKKTIYFFIGFIFFGIIFFALKDPAIRIVFTPKDKPDFYFEGVTISQIEKGDKTLVLNAKYAEIDKAKKLTQLKDVHSVFEKQNRPFLAIDAPLVTFSLDNSQLSLFDPKAVIFVEDKKIYLSSRSLLWDPLEQLLVGSGNIKIALKPSLVITGEQLRLNVPVRTIQIYQKTRSFISM